jgi:hypothetical protein
MKKRREEGLNSSQGKVQQQLANFKVSSMKKLNSNEKGFRTTQMQGRVKENSN